MWVGASIAAGRVGRVNVTRTSMSDRFETRTIVPGAVADVFDLSLSVDFHRESFAHTDEEILDGVRTGSMVLGDTVTWRARHYGIWWTMTSAITAYERPVFFVDEQVAGPFREFRHEHHYAPTDAGTELVDVVEYSAPFGFLGRLAERFFLGRHLRALIAIRNQQLVAAFESAGERMS